MRYLALQAAKPGTRFMRCRANVTHERGWRQAVFVRGHLFRLPIPAPEITPSLGDTSAYPEAPPPTSSVGMHS
ncbi:hypothetical protein CIX30_19475 [Salmonella enterica]|nr:hypothetical protein [Salmonella enterica]ECD6162110.1 hypothetical protein [Salmonella enterica subsp. enterica]ECU7994716.1 hypothetical protein [Salmonella enterica subsp. enterica serovar Toucra]EAW3043782.1 hypothetical protein [Salmonella enterica]EAW3063949.1 hypothetical protein [Salmonella enterica]